MPARAMHRIFFLALFATFAVFSTAVELLTTPRCGAVGEDRPFVPDLDNPGGHLIPAKGDFYNRTKCYCRRLEGAPEGTVWDAAYFHISYFSQSQARRFDLEWTCKAWDADIHAEFGDTECRAMQDMQYQWRPGNYRYTGCADCGDVNSLKWCYSAQRQAGIRDQSILWIKNHPRAEYLQEFGKSTPVWEEVHVACDNLCREKIDPHTGCMYDGINLDWPVATNTIEYIDDAFVLRLPGTHWSA